MPYHVQAACTNQLGRWLRRAGSSSSDTANFVLDSGVDVTKPDGELSHFLREPRVPKTYGAFAQEQRRLARLFDDERKVWRR
jgi:hypothetical protein